MATENLVIAYIAVCVSALGIIIASITSIYTYRLTKDSSRYMSKFNKYLDLVSSELLK